MALQTSGAISLNDIHVEAGGSSGTSASINDADIRALIGKASGVSMSFSEWYGASASYQYSTRGLLFSGLAPNGRTYVGHFVENSDDHVVVRSTNENLGANYLQWSLYDYTDGSRVGLCYSNVRMISFGPPIATNDGGAIVIAPTTGVQSTDFFNSNYNRHTNGKLIMYKFTNTGSVSWKLQLDDLTGKRPEYGGFTEGDYLYMYYNGLLSNGNSTRYVAKIAHTNGSVSWKKTGSFSRLGTTTDQFIYLRFPEVTHCQDVDMSDYLTIDNSVPNTSSNGESFLIKKSDGSQVTSSISNYPTTYYTKTISSAPSGWKVSSTIKQPRMGNSDDNIVFVTSDEDAKLPSQSRTFYFHNNVDRSASNDTWIGTGVYKNAIDWFKDQNNAGHWWTDGQSTYGNITSTVVNNRKFATDWKLKWAGGDANAINSSVSLEDKLFIYLIYGNQQNRGYLEYLKNGYAVLTGQTNYTDNTHKTFWGIVDVDAGKGDAMTSTNTVAYLPSSSDKKFTYKRYTSSTELFDGSDLRSGYSFGVTTYNVWKTSAIPSYGNLSNSNCLISTTANSVTTGTNSTHTPSSVSSINI